MTLSIGTAGWSIPATVAGQFAGQGSVLQRYSSRFDAVEINSSFHRPHRVSTWERWRDSVPDAFRFSVKLPRTITHQARLQGCEAMLDDFIAQVAALGEKLAVLLVQLPPSLVLDTDVATSFFAALRDRCDARVACEPRNPSWFDERAGALLDELEVARVAADPAICPAAAAPGGWRGFDYWRLHGSPVVYRSSYGDRIGKLAGQLLAGGADSWCIFDNTASSAGAGDALALVEAIEARP